MERHAEIEKKRNNNPQRIFSNDVSQICFAFNWSRGHCELSYYQWLNRNTRYPALLFWNEDLKNDTRFKHDGEEKSVNLYRLFLPRFLSRTFPRRCLSFSLS